MQIRLRMIVITMCLVAPSGYGQAAGWNTSTAGQVTTTDKVGIGTTTPSQILEVAGGAGQFSIFQRGTKQLWINPNWADNNLYSQVANRGSDGMGLSLSSRDTSPEYLFVSASGNVGVGTITPTRRLVVFDTDSNAATIGLRTTASGDGYLRGFDLQLANGNAFVFNRENGFLKIGTNGATVMTLLPGGNVGLNTVNPSSRLNVSGDLTAANFTGGNGHQFEISGATNPARELLLGFETENDYGWVQTLNRGVQWGAYPLCLQPKGGNVAIGMTGPAVRLEVRGTAATYGAARRVARLWDEAPMALGVGAGLDFIGKYNTSGAYTQFANIKGVKATASDGDFTGNLVLSVNDVAGNVVEVMRVQPGSLAVIGDANFTGTVTGGNIQAKYQDVAEWVSATDDLEPGTVVVLNPDRINEVMASTHAYDTAVAGVVSAQPGVILGETGSNKETIATTGRVRVRADATRAPIAVGDLLVTSDRPGVAMKSVPIALGDVAIHRPGTIVGKALEPLASGERDILVLLSLQ